MNDSAQQSLPKLHILTDARSASIRKAADYYRGTQNDYSGFEALWARHKNVGYKLLALSSSCPKGSTILVTVPAIDETQSASALQALRTFNGKQCTVRWYHGPKWFDALQSVGALFSQGEKEYTRDEITCNVSNFYDKEEKEEAGSSDSHIETLKKYIEYRLMYLFLGADTDAQALRSIIAAISQKKEENFSLPQEDTVTSGAMKKLVDRYAQFGYPSLAGRSTVIENLKEQLARYAKADINVLIVGETGTGKEAIAYLLHELSPRRTNEYVTINCACFSDELLESELFGHTKGAYTGASQDKRGLVEKADNGTIFLDELPDASPRTQAKLLRFLESGEFSPVGSNTTRKVDVKIVAGGQPGKIGLLRSDFIHRIATGIIKTYPLRALNDHWKNHKQETGKEPDIITMARNLAVRLRGESKSIGIAKGFAANREIVTHHDIVAIWQELDECTDLFINYNWPGNVRELFNTMKKRLCFGLSLEEAIDEQKDLSQYLVSPSGAGATAAAAPSPVLEPITFNVRTLNDVLTIEEMKIQYVRHVHQRLKQQGITDKEIRKKLDLASATYTKYKSTGAKNATGPASTTEGPQPEVAGLEAPKSRSR